MIKQLLAGGSKDLQRAVFRMEMAIRKSNIEKSRESAAKVKELLAQEMEGLVI